MQICRPLPSYAATDGQTIVRYLREAGNGDMMTLLTTGPDPHARYEENTKVARTGCTIRPATEAEFVFETDEVVAPIGTTALELKERAEKEGWVGTRVDLWFDVGYQKGALVKVKYWWRREGNEWVQILHDIMYMGPRDGTEGTDGEVLE
jgi:hypothetical protein